jgi:hypothetical protein
MRFLAIDILILAAVFGGLYVVYRWLLQQREYKQAKKVAQFTGGPLNGKSVNLRKLPEVYNYQYDRPQTVQATENNPKPEPIPCWYNARYERVGSTDQFEYKGSVPIDKLTQYDLPDVDD